MSSKKRKQNDNFDIIFSKIKIYKELQNNRNIKDKELIEINNNISINNSNNNNNTLLFSDIVSEVSNILITSNFKNKTKLGEALKFLTNYTITKFEIKKLEEELNTYPTEITHSLYNAVNNYNQYFDIDKQTKSSKPKTRKNNSKSNDGDDDDDDDDDDDENYNDL